jgi:hypothetical protein
MNVDVRLGSLADILQRNRDVCFAPESGHVQRTRPCLLRANRGHSAIHFLVGKRNAWLFAANQRTWD